MQSMNSPVFRFLVLLPAILLAGCVLPGGLRSVGHYEIHGQLLDADGQGLSGKNILLLEPHASKADKKLVEHLALGPVPDAIDSRIIALTTDAQGEFHHTFAGFTHCHPFWVFPPLFELPCQLSGSARHGSIFLMKTPGNEGLVYEIEIKQPQLRIRTVDPVSAKLRKLKAGDESVLGVTALTNEVRNAAGSQIYTQTFSKVLLEIKRPRQRE